MAKRALGFRVSEEAKALGGTNGEAERVIKVAPDVGNEKLAVRAVGVPKGNLIEQILCQSHLPHL